MIIKTFTVGSFASNSYLVVCEETKGAVLIDAGGDYNVVAQEIENLHANLKYIFYTHAHLDHISGGYDIRVNKEIKAFLHSDDKFLLDKFKEQLAIFGMPDTKSPTVDEFIKDGQILEVGTLKFKVIHTPGHSPGSVCYLADNVLFSGDTLFADSVGRTDLPGGSYKQLKDSIVNKLFVLDENIKVYPGHGQSTTIGHEKENNPFFGKQTR